MKYAAVVIITFLLGVSIWGVVYFDILRHDEVYDEIEVVNLSFKIRITAYREKGVLLPGVYFVFRSAPANSDKWQDVLTLRGDEPVPIRRNQLGLVSDRIGYGFGTIWLPQMEEMIGLSGTQRNNYPMTNTNEPIVRDTSRRFRCHQTEMGV